MKKIVGIFILTTTLICVASCDYDDSNDIDIIKPNDTTETGINIQKFEN